MGLFIPPNSDKNNKSKDSSEKEDGNKVIFYTRPSVGLKIWGPLVPASDYLPGLYGLTALQILFGLTMFRHVKLTWYHTSFMARISKLFSAASGSYMVFNSGLEISRLILPYDPWYEEAKSARMKAIQKGEKPNFWFGPLDHRPMDFKQWSAKVDGWVEETESQMEHQEASEEKISPTFNIKQSPQFRAVYEQIRLLNKERNREILKNLKMPGLQDFLGANSQTYVNPEFDRPELVVPEDNELKTNLDLLEVWELNDPWESLGRDTDYVVRFIPKFRWFEKLEETQNYVREQEQKMKENEVTVIVDEKRV